VFQKLIYFPLFSFKKKDNQFPSYYNYVDILLREKCLQEGCFLILDLKLVPQVVLSTPVFCNAWLAMLPLTMEIPNQHVTGYMAILNNSQYSELSIKRTPLGPGPTVHLREVSVLQRV